MTIVEVTLPSGSHAYIDIDKLDQHLDVTAVDRCPDCTIDIYRCACEVPS